MAWSILTFSGREIVNLAVEVEKAGREFYRAAAARAGDPAVREMLEKLATEEEKHVGDFSSLADKLPADFTPPESYHGEYMDYLKALIEDHIFNQQEVDALVAALKDERDVLRAALRFEKDSILFFQEFAALVGEVGHGILARLVAEEREHIKKLTHLCRSGH